MKNNSNNSILSFVDETKNIKAKAKVMKRNHQYNIRNTRLRKTLQNNKLLENYFEWDDTAPSSSDLTVYKIITPPPSIHASIHARRNETNLVDWSPSDKNPLHVTSGTSKGRKPSKKNQVITSEKIQVKAPTNRKNSLVSDNCNSGHVNTFSTPNSSSSNISTDPPITHSMNSNLLACYNYFQQVIGNYSRNLIDQNEVLLNSSSSCSSVGDPVISSPIIQTTNNVSLPSSNISSKVGSMNMQPYDIRNPVDHSDNDSNVDWMKNMQLNMQSECYSASDDESFLSSTSFGNNIE